VKRNPGQASRFIPGFRWVLNPGYTLRGYHGLSQEIRR
jgi:hypothetical protein